MKIKSLLTALALLVAGNAAYAADIYKTGFENPPFVLDPLVVLNPDGSPTGKQDGWTGIPPLSPGAAKISSVKPRQGKQSVLIRGEDLKSQPNPINAVTAGYYDAIGNYRKTVDFDTQGTKTVRISVHARVNGKRTANGDNFFSASTGGRGADVLSTIPSGTIGIGELAISSDGHVYGYSGNEDVPGCEVVPCNPPATFLASRPVSLNEWHRLTVEINFKKRTYAFSVDDACMGSFPFVDTFTGNYLRRGFMNVYTAPDTLSLKKANYSASFDQFKISEVDNEEDCIP